MVNDSTRIIVLDGKTLNPGDNPWDEVSALGNLVVHDRTPPGEVLHRVQDAKIVVTNKAVFDAETLDQLPNLEFIAVTATGYNVVDVDHARKCGIAVSNVPAYSTQSVAQHVFAMLLSYLHQPMAHDAAVKAGRWKQEQDFSFWLQPLSELAGKTMGIVGLGRIGRATAKVADALGMRIVAASRTRSHPLPYPEFEWLETDSLFAESDVISLHCPLTSDNHGFVNASLLESTKADAILINTARGDLINEKDLAEALQQGQLRAALLDVCSTEPIEPNNPLLTAPNCILTPHIAWATLEARRRAMQVTANNIAAFLNGNPINLVN